jgi:hypothetical protein
VGGRRSTYRSRRPVDVVLRAARQVSGRGVRRGPGGRGGDLQAAVDGLAADGYELVGGIGQYEHIWRMAYVRGPEGIIVSLAERIG